MKKLSILQEDLRKWFSKTDPGGDWKRINSKGEAIGPCAREPGEPKPKCMSRAKRESLTKKERASAVRAKRKHDPDPERKGSPINVSNFGKGKISEDMENLNEKNVPTNPELWSRAKSLARSKFDVYPSAYANGWASKWYKGKGGSWKSVSEESEQLEEVREVGDDPTTADYPEGLNVKKGRVVTKMTKEEKDPKEYGYEGDMAINQLKTIMRHAEYLIDMMEPDTDLPEWVQSKITLAADYIQTSCDYLTSEMDESVNESDVYGKPTTAKTPTVTLKHKTSGKEIVVTKKSAPGYKRIGYYVSEEFSKTGKEATHNKTGEKTYEYAKVDKEGRKTGEREYRNAQGKPMGEEFAGYIAHYNGQKHEIKSHEAKDLYDAKQKAIAHFKIPKSKHGLLSVKPGHNEAVNYGNAYPGLGDDVVDKKKKLNPQPNLTMKPKRVKDFIDKTYKGYSEDVELDESLITGTKKISTHKAGQHKAEVRHSSEYNEFQVHYYKDGKHRGEGPVSYHENDRADATASAKREIERLGKTQKEEVEQIDELSKRTLARYAKRATSSMKMKQMAATHLRDKHRDASDKHQSGVFNRETGIKRAIDKLAGKYYHEDVEQIDEISRDLADRYLGKVTQQQVQKQGMQPNMYDKLPKNRQQGVSNALKRTLVKSPVKEETEQIDELSKDTLKSYYKGSVESGMKAQHRATNTSMGGSDSEHKKNIADINKRVSGQDAVTKRLGSKETMSMDKEAGVSRLAKYKPTKPNPKKYSEEFVEESKAHKVLATFMKNREVAQRAFTGQNKPKGPDSIMARNKHINDLMKSQVKESRKAEIIKDIMKKKKSEKFEPDPVLSDTKSKSDLTA